MKNKKTHKQFTEWIEDKISLYRHLLSLNAWSVSIGYNPVKFESSAVFEVIWKQDYLSAACDWSQEAFNLFCKEDFQSLERGLIHEMCHLLLSDLRRIALARFTNQDEYSHFEEKACDHIAHTLHRMLKGWKPNGL